MACILDGTGAPPALAGPADDFFYAEFPRDAAIANLTMTASHQHGWKTGAKEYVKAQGRVKIPRDNDIKVELLFAGPAHMKDLEQLEASQLVRFSAAKLDLNDEQFSHLRKFKGLLAANLQDTLLTDKSLAIIGTWKDLVILRLSNTDITGSGFDNLAKCVALRSLNLDGIALKPGTLSKLKSLDAKLTSLNLAQCNLTAVDAQAIGNFIRVSHLDLEGNKLFDNKCLRMLLPLRHLKAINLADTAVDENCLADLYKFPKLQSVIVRRRNFWKNGQPKPLKNGIEIYDRADKARMPVEMFSPLH